MKQSASISIVPQDIARVILNLVTNAFYAVTAKAVNVSAANSSYEPIVSVTTKRSASPNDR